MPGYTDRLATERFANELERNVERMRRGLGPLEHMQLASPLSELLDGFRKHLRAKGTSAKQIREKCNRISRIIKACSIEKWNDIVGSQVEHFLIDLHSDGDGKSVRAAITVNGYLESIKHFCSWLQKEKRAPYNPVGHLCCLNGDTDRRHVRRALSVEECGTCYGRYFTAGERAQYGKELKAQKAQKLQAEINRLERDKLAALSEDRRRNRCSRIPAIID